jgi:hypothetical protein
MESKATLRNNNTKNFHWIRESLAIRETASLGKAATTTTSIKKGELVIVFGGYVMSIEDENQLPEKIRDMSLQISPHHVIGIKNENEISIAEYVNHSCEPNCGIKGQISLVALRDISAGEDITFDYGTVLFSNMGGGGKC